jgi:hypothetical protein
MQRLQFYVFLSAFCTLLKIRSQSLACLKDLAPLIHVSARAGSPEINTMDGYVEFCLLPAHSTCCSINVFFCPLVLSQTGHQLQ